MTLLVAYVLLALGVSFLCSIMEAVLLSVTPSFVALQERKNAVFAGRLRQLKDDIDRPLAAILSLNTIAHTVGATGAGAQATIVFGNAYLGVISAVLTLLILVLSEIIPKTLGAVYWRSLVPAVVRVLWPLIWLMWPLVKLSQGLTGVLSRGHRRASVSREEMTAMAELGAREGVIEREESRILKRLFLFRSLRARDVMTPRTVLFLLNEATTVGQVVSDEAPLRFSRIPVFSDGPDDITGFVLKDELLLRAARDELELPLREIRRPLVVVPETLELSTLLARFVAGRDHIALIVDEYGGTAGIVTLEDILETLLGLEIVDEADANRDMQVLARQKWVDRARELGILTTVDENDDRDAAVRLGLTGMRPEPGPRLSDEDE